MLVNHLTKGGPANGKRRVARLDGLRRGLSGKLFFSPSIPTTGPRRVLMLDNGGNVAPAAPTLAYIIDDQGWAQVRCLVGTPPCDHRPTSIKPQINAVHHGEQAEARCECDDSAADSGRRG